VLGLGLVAGLAAVPVAAAHETTSTGGLARWHGGVLALAGIGTVGAAVAARRTAGVSAAAALRGVLLGLAVAALGVTLFDGLSPDPVYTAGSIPFPRSWYAPVALVTGLSVVVTSFVVGWLRWPGRPRYAFLGIVLGLWIAYPYLLPEASHTHPLGYAIVLVTPLLVGYILRTDAGDALRAIRRDPVARRFGAGVAVVTALFFLTITGYLSFLPEEGMPHGTTVVVLPVIYQLVTWPTLEVVLPHVPLFLAVSPGQIVVVGVLSGLVGVNAGVIARRWRVEERAGLTQGTAGTVAVVGSCTCGCCGPLVAKVAVLAAGPSVAAPLYWVFVDAASPLSTVFVVAGIVLFVASLLYSIRTAEWTDRSSADSSPA